MISTSLRWPNLTWATFRGSLWTRLEVWAQSAAQEQQAGALLSQAESGLCMCSAPLKPAALSDSGWLALEVHCVCAKVCTCTAQGVMHWPPTQGDVEPCSNKLWSIPCSMAHKSILLQKTCDQHSKQANELPDSYAWLVKTWIGWKFSSKLSIWYNNHINFFWKKILLFKKEFAFSI